MQNRRERGRYRTEKQSREKETKKEKEERERGSERKDNAREKRLHERRRVTNATEPPRKGASREREAGGSRERVMLSA